MGALSGPLNHQHTFMHIENEAMRTAANRLAPVFVLAKQAFAIG